MQQRSGQTRGYLTRGFVFLFASHLIVVSTYFLFITTMARHAIDTFACSDGLAGLVASIFLVGAAIARILAGRYADAMGLKRCSIIALVVMLACCLAYYAGDMCLPLILVIRVAHGMAFGVANTTMPALAAKIIPAEVMGEGMGWFMLSNSLGVGIGPLFGLVMSGQFDYSVLYWTCALLISVVALPASIISTRNTSESNLKEKHPDAPPFKLSNILDPETRKFSFYMFIVAVAYSSINAFVSVYAGTVGLEGSGPFVFLAYSISLVVVRPLFGKLQDRKGENYVLYPSIASMALGTLACAACAVAPSTPLLMLAGVFAATGFGTCMSTGLAVIGIIAKGKSAAPGIATFYLLCDFGCGIGPFLLGFVAGAFGYPAMYLACSGIALIGVVYYHFAYGRYKLGRQPHQTR